MTTADDQLSRELARLSAEFVAQLPQQITAVSRDLDAWCSAPGEAPLFEQLCRKVHRLKGAGGTFGCSGISDAARVLEQCLAAWQTRASEATNRDVSDIEAAMAALEAQTTRIQGESARGGPLEAQT